MASVSALRSQAQTAKVPPVRALGSVIARTTVPIGAVGNVVELHDGRVAVNDTKSHRVLLFDPSLAHPVVVLDSAGSPDRLYPADRGGNVIRYLGDSLLFADPASRAFLVISPAGTVARVVSFPGGPAPLAGYTAVTFIRSAASGDLAYWTTTVTPCGDHRVVDSVPIRRTNFSTRRVDTLAFARLNKLDCISNQVGGTSASPLLLSMAPEIRGAGGTTVPSIQNRDDWAYFSDGTLAIVRAQTYSIDWVDPDGTHRSTPRIAADWKPLTDADKTRIMDSVRAVYTPQADSLYKAALANPKVATLAVPLRNALTSQYFLPKFLDPAELPDYWRAFQSPVRADREGMLWVAEGVHELTRPGAPPPPSIMDIINHKGVLIDRARLPDGTRLVDFGAGVVYLTSSNAGGVTLMRVLLK